MSQANPASDKERYFQTDHLKKGLRARAIRGGAITLSSQGVRFALSISSTVVLARLLRPEDFGLIAMAAALTGFVAIFKDLGLSMATVQRKEITRPQISTLFWFNVGLGAVVTLIAASLSPVVAWFFGDSRLIGITVLLSSAFVISGLGIQHKALLKRDMRFGTLSFIEITSETIAVTMVILLALNGAGYWALVLMPIISAVVGTALSWIMSGWIPGLPVRNSGVRSMLRFGGYMSGSQVSRYFFRRFDNLLIGRFIGAEQLGLYSKAYGLLMLPIQQINQPISNVLLPVLSRLQDDPERFRAYYFKSILLLVTIGMPIVTFSFITADRLIPSLLGAQWATTAVIFKALAPAMFIGTVNVAGGWLNVALGRPERQLRWQMVTGLVSILGFAIGLNWGVVGVATSFSITMCILMLPGWMYAFRGTPITISQMMVTLWRPATAAVIAAFAVHLTNSAMYTDLPEMYGLVIDGIVFGAAYILAWVLPPGGLRTIRHTISLITSLRTQNARKVSANA